MGLPPQREPHCTGSPEPQRMAQPSTSVYPAHFQFRSSLSSPAPTRWTDRPHGRCREVRLVSGVAIGCEREGRPQVKPAGGEPAGLKLAWRGTRGRVLPRSWPSISKLRVSNSRRAGRAAHASARGPTRDRVTAPGTSEESGGRTSSPAGSGTCP